MSDEMHPALLAANEADASPISTRTEAERVIKAYLFMANAKPGKYEFYHGANGTTHRLSDAILFILPDPTPDPQPARFGSVL